MQFLSDRCQLQGFWAEWDQRPHDKSCCSRQIYTGNIKKARSASSWCGGSSYLWFHCEVSPKICKFLTTVNLTYFASVVEYALTLQSSQLSTACLPEMRWILEFQAFRGQKLSHSKFCVLNSFKNEIDARGGHKFPSSHIFSWRQLLSVISLTRNYSELYLR